MNIYLLSEYIKRLTKQDILKFSTKQGIILDNKELDIIYTYIKENYKTLIYGNPTPILKELKQQVNPITYNKIETLYKELKYKI